MGEMLRVLIMLEQRLALMQSDNSFTGYKFSSDSNVLYHNTGISCTLRDRLIALNILVFSSDHTYCCRHAGRVQTLAKGTSPSSTCTALQTVVDCSIVSVQSGSTCTFGDAWQPNDSSVSFLVFFTHWADLGSLELAQRLVEKIPELEAAGTH